MDLQRLEHSRRFEDLCKQLLLNMYGDELKTVDGRGGDEGTDSFLGTINNQKCIFQFKFFQKNLTSNHWDKIKESLGKSSEKKPERWILLISSEFTINDWKKWEELQRQYPDIQLEVWLAPYLEYHIRRDKSLILAFPELFPSYEIAKEAMELTKTQSILVEPTASIYTSTESPLSMLNRYNNNILNPSEEERERVERCIKEFNEMMRDIGERENQITQLNVKSMGKLANYYNRKEDYDRAIFLYGLILREYRDDLRSINNKGAALFAEGDYQQALELAESALKIYPDYLDGKVNKAAALLELGRLEEGISILEDVYSLNPEDDVVLKNLVLAYSKLGNVSKTEEYYNKAKPFVSDIEHLMSSLGYVYLTTHNYEKALDIFNAILKKDPDNIKAKINKALALTELDLHIIATSILEGVIRQELENSIAMTNLAYVNARRGMYDLAIAWGLKALTIDTSDIIALNAIGISYARLGDYDEAIKCYNKALSVKPAYLHALANKSIALILLGKLKEALDCMNEYLKHDPSDTVIQHNRDLAVKLLKKDEL